MPKKKSIHISRRHVEIIAAAAICILVILTSYFRIFDVFELATLDFRFKIRPTQKISDDIVLIEIAKDTLDQLGSWPIDRGYYARLVDVLTEFKARYIIFDIAFSQKSTEASDQMLVESIGASEKTYIAGIFQDPSKSSGFPTVQEKNIFPFPAVSHAAKGIGHINIISDIDGIRRRLPLLVKYQGTLFPQLSFLAVCDYFGKSPKDLTVVPGRYIELTPKIKIPIDEHGMTIINYAGKWEETFQHYSFIDILKSDIQIQKGEKPRLDLNKLKDKICIIGLTASGTHDLQPTPVQSKYPMVGAHANIINSIFTNSFIIRVNRLTNVFILILLAIATSLLAFRLSPSHSLFAALALIIIFAVIAFALFAFLNIWINLVYPILLISLVYLFSTFYKYISEKNKRMVLEKELDIARNIQKSFLKATPTEKSGLDICVRMDTAKAVGGDLYDFVDMPDDKIGIMIGDVSGKGVPAALFMAKTVSEFRFCSRAQGLPEHTMKDLNDLISTESTSGLFVTICYLIIDIKQKQLHIVDAGHLPVIAAHKNRPTEALEVEGEMAVGIMDGIEYTQKTFSFEQGDVFLLYTDGVTETWNIKKEEFGQQRIEEALTESKARPAKEIIQELFKRIIKFQGKAPQHDDITAIAIKIK